MKTLNLSRYFFLIGFAFLLLTIADSAFAAERSSVSSGPSGAKSSLSLVVTDQPQAVFEAWSVLGGMDIRSYSIHEYHLGFPDLLHSRQFNEMYSVPNPTTSARYFRKQTVTSSWSYGNGMMQGDMNFYIRKSDVGQIEFGPGSLHLTSRESDGRFKESWMAEGTTPVYQTITLNGDKGWVPGTSYYNYGRQTLVVFPHVTHNNAVGAVDYLDFSCANPNTSYFYNQPLYMGVDTINQTAPSSPVFGNTIQLWNESKIEFHCNPPRLGDSSAILNYTLDLSDEDTLDFFNARIAADRQAADLSNIPWLTKRRVGFGGANISNSSYRPTDSALYLYNHHSDYDASNDFEEERGELRFSVPSALQIPGIVYRGRVLEVFYADSDPDYHGQIVKIHEVEMKEGHWQSDVITPVMRPEDGETDLQYFSVEAESIQSHPILPLPGTDPNAATAPQEYVASRPTFVSQDLVSGGKGTRKVLTGSLSLQQINLSDSWRTLADLFDYGQIAATAGWSVLSGATAQVRLWRWTDDGSALGKWHLVGPSDDLADYFGSTKDYIFAEALTSGRATVRITVNVDGQEVHDDLEISTQTPELAVDANRDGQIKLASEDVTDATSADKPYRFWLNDDDDGERSAQDCTDNVVNGWNDLKKDFFPVFLDIKQLLNVLPPGSGGTYKLKQADSALNFVYTDLTRATAFRFKDGHSTELFTASTTRITADGVPLSTTFLSSVKDGDQGVLLMEGRAVTTQPLVLEVEKNGIVVAQMSLNLSIAPNILLLLHGMNSNVDTWDDFIDSSQTFYIGGSGVISDGAIQSTPSINYNGIRCYRLQFGAYDMASTRAGVEGVTAANTPGYDTVGTRCGDFETFDQLGQEVEEAIRLLLARHPSARIVLVGHSRGGLSARAFLEKPGSSDAKAAVIDMLTTSSPNLGSRMGRIYGWLNTHQRGTSQGYTDDWQVVDFLVQPTAYGQPKTVLDVRRPVILDVADDSLAIANLNSQAAVQNLPDTVRYGEIQYANAHFGLMTVTPVRYSVLEHTGTGGIIFPQLSNAAADFLLNGGAPGDVQFIGDGLIPRANQRFTQLPGFSGVAISPRLITGQEIVHIGAPSQIADLLAQLNKLAPELFP